MPKLKTHQGAAKRFKQTAKSYKRRQSHRNHILTKKATKRKRKLRNPSLVNPCDIGFVYRMLRGS